MVPAEWFENLKSHLKTHRDSIAKYEHLMIGRFNERVDGLTIFPPGLANSARIVVTYFPGLA